MPRLRPTARDPLGCPHQPRGQGDALPSYYWKGPFGHQGIMPRISPRSERAEPVVAGVQATGRGAHFVALVSTEHTAMPTPSRAVRLAMNCGSGRCSLEHSWWSNAGSAAMLLLARQPVQRKRRANPEHPGCHTPSRQTGPLGVQRLVGCRSAAMSARCADV